MSSPPQLYTMPPLSPSPDSPILPDSLPLPPLFIAESFSPAFDSEPSQTAKVPRPLNPFMLFRSHFLKTNQIPPDTECRQQNISCIVGECWNMLPAAEKAVWRRKAEEAKRAHMARHPDYRYRPIPRGTKATKKVRAKKPRDEASALEKKERTRELRELYTTFKGEAVPSQRTAKQLARATRPKKGAASASASATEPGDATDTVSPFSLASSSSSSTTTTDSILFAPLPIHPPSGAFVPSSTRLAPAPSAGPQITRITQSPPLTPFHPSDRQPQLQLPEITLRNPWAPQRDFHSEREFWQGSSMGGMSLSQGSVYPPMGMNHASAYFEPRGYGMPVTMPASDVDNFRARSHSLDVGMGNMTTNHFLDTARSRSHSLDVNMIGNTNASHYFDFHGNYPAFSAFDGGNNFMGNYRDAPQTPSDLSEYSFSPAVPPVSPAWSGHAQTPSVYSSSQPQTPLTLTPAAPFQDYGHGPGHEHFTFSEQPFQAQPQAQAAFGQPYEHKFEQQGGLGLFQPGLGADAGDFGAAAVSHAATGAHDHGAWDQEFGAGGLEIELGTILHF